MVDRKMLSDSNGKIASETSEGRPALSRSIVLFLVITAALSSIFYAFIIATGHVGGGNGVYELGLMWSPAIAALLTCRLSGLSLQSLGWGWGTWRWQWLAFAIPLGYTAVAYAIVWLSGYGGFPDAKFVDSTRASLGWPGAPDCLVLGGYFLLIGSAGMALSMAFVMLGMSVIMAWLRLRSGSLWTAAVFHASHNQFIQVFFTPATSVRGTKTSFAIDEFGFALPAVVLILAIVFWRLASKPVPTVLGY